MQMFHSLDKDEFILSYLDDHEVYGGKSPFVVHVRIATHGSVTEANCHPFVVPMQGDSEMVMMHNGILGKMDSYVKDTDLTDTQGLIDHVITSMQDDWLDNNILAEFVEDFIDYSKLVFLTTNPDLKKQMYIINEDMGIWREDVWYSNYALFDYKSKNKQYDYKSKDYQKQGTEHTVCSEGDDAISWWENGEKQYGWYLNGAYQEGSYADFDQKHDTFEDWLVDTDDLRVEGAVLANASAEDHVGLFNQSMTFGDACCVCTGMKACHCDDLCFECYEPFTDCGCNGAFISLTDSFRASERVQAIADAAAEAEELESNVVELVVPF